MVCNLVASRLRVQSYNLFPVPPNFFAEKFQKNLLSPYNQLIIINLNSKKITRFFDLPETQSDRKAPATPELLFFNPEKLHIPPRFVNFADRRKTGKQVSARRTFAPRSHTPMKNLRTIRIILTLLFLAAAIAYACFPKPAHPAAALMPYTQIVPSMIAVSIGAILFWLAATFLLGRAYCAAFCPVGAIQDGVIFLRRKISPRRRPRRYRPHRNVRYHLLIIYIVCLISGFLAVPYLLEPWNMFLNIASAVNADATQATWIRLGTGTATGVAAGIVSLVAIAVWAWFADRDFCNTVCPVGTVLGLPDNYQLMHIEIDPDLCVNCGKCEETCRAGCIKVLSRYVDNSRCVLCFDCLAACPNDAIRYQSNRNRPATPLSRRVGRAGR